MTEPKRYDVALAMATMVLASSTATDNELRGMIVAASDVPEECLDRCLHELKQGLEPLRLICMISGLTTVQQVADVFRNAEWIDDDKKLATYNMSVVDEDHNEIASSTTRVKLD